MKGEGAFKIDTGGIFQINIFKESDTNFLITKTKQGIGYVSPFCNCNATNSAILGIV